MKVVYAASALEQFSAAESDGSLLDRPSDDVYDITAIAAMDPESVGLALNDPSVGFSPESAQSALLAHYFDQLAVQDFADARDETQAIPEAMKDARLNVMFNYAGLSPEQAERVKFDAQSGDTSAMTRIKERFYLG